ncbi:MAG: flagellar basal body rod protein FlgB [Fimbriimonadales bacterium]|nr:flagellar basal body rod protein FlgB [Fimbriimonadales bacterium]
MPSPVQTRYRTFWDTPVLRAAERAMDHAAARQRLLANNLANVNTPGYLRHDLTMMQTRPANRAVELAQQHGIPIPQAPTEWAGRPSYALAAGAGRPGYEAVPMPTAMRTDGNTVDPERELAALAENELRYAMLVRIAGGQIRGLLDAITGGRAP